MEKDNKLLAKFMDYFPIGPKDGAYAESMWSSSSPFQWEPNKDLNQLFLVVDAIRKTMNWKHHIWENEGKFRSVFGHSKKGVQITVDHPVRKDAIYSSCLEAIKHIKGQKILNRHWKVIENQG